MRKYIVKRLLLSIFILFCVAIIVYSIMRCIPSSFVEKKAMERAAVQGGNRSYQDWVDILSVQYGLGGNIVTGFFNWLGKVLQGDFGESWKFSMPVVEKFSQVIGDSFYLALVTLFLRVIIAIPLGILSARKQYTRTDYIITFFALVGISLPVFFFATIAKLIFSVNLGWFDLFGKVGRDYMTLDPWGQALDIAKHYVMPVLTITIINVGDLMRYTRTNMLEVLNSDYIRTARAKGVPEKRVINHHAFRNTLIPIVTLVGGTLPSLFNGAMLTEILFQLPGIGYTSYQAIIEGDIPFTMFYLMFLAALTLVGTLLSDILYAAVDPRIRIG